MDLSVILASPIMKKINMNPYSKVDRQLHSLSQLIAKLNRTYVPAKEDDSHTNLFYEPLGNRITGRWIRANSERILPTLSLKDQTFQFLDSSFQVMESVKTFGKKIRDIEKEMEALLPGLGLSPEGFIDELHFKITEYDFAEQPIEALNPKGLQPWMEYRALANQACFAFLGHAQAHEEVRIWPHHFDTGIYFKAKNDLGVGFGLAMEDSIAGAPYFYLSAYPEGRDIVYHNLPSGKWRWEIGDHWNGAILTLDELQSYTDPKKSEPIYDYINSVYHWMITQ